MGSNTEQWAEYHWKETSPLIFQRSITPREIFFNPAMGMSVWASITLGSVPHTSTQGVFINLIRDAWTQVLYHQPHLASTYDFSSQTCTYKGINSTTLAVWLEEAFIVVANDQDPHASVITSSKPALCLNPATRGILFRAPHFYIDGIGSIPILQDLVCHIAKLSQQLKFPIFSFNGRETKNLAPVFEIAAYLPAPRLEDNARGAGLILNFIQSIPSVTLAISLRSASEVDVQPPSSKYSQCSHSISKVTFSHSASKALLAACKSKGITITHAVHATLVLATTELDHLSSDSEGKKFYSSVQSANWCSKVQPQHAQHHGTLYSAAFPLVVPDVSEMDFGALAMEFKHIYVRNATNLDLARSQQMIWSFVPPLPLPGAPAEAQTLLLSSLGIVETFLEREVNRVEVKGFEFGLNTTGGVVTVYL